MSVEKKYILVIDEGTTSVRSLLFDRAMQIVGASQLNTTTYHPEKAGAEQDAMEIWEKTVRTMRGAVKDAGADPEEIAAVAITTQRATWTFWNRETGKPIRRSLVWSDSRACYIKDRYLSDPVMMEKYPELDAQFYYTDQHTPFILKYLTEKEPGLAEELGKETTIGGTVDTWLIYNLTGKKVHATCLSHAAMTMFYTFKTEDWNWDYVEQIAGLRRSAMAQIKPDMYEYGTLTPDILGAEIPILSNIADQHSALFCQGCHRKGQAKGTIGTGFFFNVNQGMDDPVFVRGYKTAFCWEIGDDRPYIFEGTLPVAGAALEWLRNQLKLIGHFSEMEPIATSVEDSGGIYFIPALEALCNPPFGDVAMEGLFIGITAGNDQRHFVRAVLDGVSFICSFIILDSMEKMGAVNELRIDGGVTRSDLICQTIANVTGVKMIRGKNPEATAMGTAEISAIKLGWMTMEDVESFLTVEKVFLPNEDQEKNRKQYQWWLKAKERAGNWNPPVSENQ